MDETEVSSGIDREAFRARLEDAARALAEVRAEHARVLASLSP